MAPEETTGLTKEEAAKDVQASSEKKPESRPLDYVMINHLGYAREYKKHRAERAGGRRQRFTLGNGRQIRAKGPRYTEVSFEDLLKNFNQLLKGVKEGFISVCRPDNLEAMTVEQLVDLGARLAQDYEFDHVVDETLLEPLFGSDLTDKKVWVEKPKGKDTEITKPSLEPAVIAAEERKKLDEAKPAETGLLDDHGEEVKADAPAEVPAEAEGEESEDEGETLTEEQMMEMSVKDLQKLAKDYGVKKPEKLHAKKDLVDAIIEASKEQE